MVSVDHGHHHHDGVAAGDQLVDGNPVKVGSGNRYDGEASIHDHRANCPRRRQEHRIDGQGRSIEDECRGIRSEVERRRLSGC